MNASDDSVSPDDGLKLARARLTSAEASVTSAKKEAKAAKARRKEAKEAERQARKRLRRAKKELREAKRVVAEAEKIQTPPPRPRRLKPIMPVIVKPPVVAPRRVVRAKGKPRKRVVPALKPNSALRPATEAPPVESKSKPVIVPPVAEQPPITAPQSPPAQSE